MQELGNLLSDIEGMVIENCWLEGTIFKRCIMNGMDFIKTDIRGCTFEECSLEKMKEMYIGASHEQPPEGAETSKMAPPPEVEFIENVGKAVSYMADTASSAVEAVENFLNDCACEVSSWDWGFFNSLLDGARGYSGEGGGFS